MSNELSSNEIPKKLSCTTCACPLGGDSGNGTTEARAKDAVHASAETRKKTWRSEVERIKPGNTQTAERYKAKRLSEKEGPKECVDVDAESTYYKQGSRTGSRGRGRGTGNCCGSCTRARAINE